MRTALISSIIIIFILGFLLFTEKQNKTLREDLYQDSIKVLQNDKVLLERREMALNEQIDLSILTGKEKDRLLEEKRSEINKILNRPPRTVIIRDTVEYIQDCEQTKELYQNSLEQIEILESKVLILDDVINDQQELIKNLRQQVRKTEEIILHTNALLEIEKEKSRKHRRNAKLAIIGGGIVLILGILE